VIPRTVLIAIEPFGDGIDAARAAAAIGRGLQAADPSLAVDLCPIGPATPESAHAAAAQAPHDFDRRMRTARAIVVGGERLDEHTLLGSATFALATRARQAGVPAYAVTADNRLNLFDARILDLQVVLQARDTRALRKAGERLAELV
jgi:glycerate kinase